MKKSADYRAIARQKLAGNWGKTALISLGYFVVFFILGFIEGLMPENIKSIFSLATTVIEVPLAFGLIISFYKLFNSENVKPFDFLKSGFSNFKRSWLISLTITLKMIIPIIMIIVSIVLIGAGMATTSFSAISGSSTTGGVFLGIIGIILYLVGIIWAITKSYYYQLAYIVAIDNEGLSNKEVVEKCKEIMEGKRSKLFCLQFSFIGWIILAGLTLGIGMLWLTPYIQYSSIAFYEDAIGKNEEPSVTE